MTMRIFAFGMLLLIGIHLIAQDTIYLDRNWQPCLKHEAAYLRVGQETDGLFRFTDFFAQSKQIQKTGAFQTANQLRPTGDWEWYAEPGFKRFDYHFEQGTFQGRQREWNDQGDLVAEYETNSGSLHGMYRSWYDSGKPEQFGSFDHGELDGLLESWYETGTKRFEAHYDSGTVIGNYQMWHESGEPMVNVRFDEEGTPQDTGYRWFANGRVAEVWDYTARPFPTYTTYYSNGEPCRKGYLNEGRLVVVDSAWDEAGVPQIERRKGQIRIMDSNGSLVARGPYKNGLPHGKWTLYYGSDSLKRPQASGRMKQGFPRGEWIVYQRDGAIFSYEKGKTLTPIIMPRLHREDPRKIETKFLPLNLKSLQKEIGYPPQAVRMKIEGEVLVKFQIDENGRVYRFWVVTGPDLVLTRAVAYKFREIIWVHPYGSSPDLNQWGTLPIRFRLIY